MALALQAGWRNIRHRNEIKKNIEHLSGLTEACVYTASWEIPVRLIAYPEMVCQGVPDAIEDMDHVEYARTIAVEIPGEETDLFGEIAKRFNVYIIGQMKSVEPDIMKDRYFNTAFVINPKGKVMVKHHKIQLVVVSGTTSVHDVWDAYVKARGDRLESFFQVADTEIGRIGPMICMEGSYPEIARGFAMCGAEILYRPSFNEPETQHGWWEVQNRARALDNTCYMIAPNTGPCLDTGTPVVTDGGNSMVIDYRGQVLGRAAYTNEGSAAGIINIDVLREYRSRALFGNWLPTLRTECYQKIYAEPIYPKNLYLKQPRPKHKAVENYLRESIKRLQDRGIYLTSEIHEAMKKTKTETEHVYGYDIR